MTGDIFDDRISNDDSIVFLHTVSKEFPCYYVCGNHEIYTGKVNEIKASLSDMGITVLEGETVEVCISGQIICIGGIDDPYGFPDKRGRLWEDQLEECSQAISEECFSVLLTHRPELAALYADTDFDLILSGHAHGGQVIIPGIINGLYAPPQGFLPKYAGGTFTLKDSQTMVVSRGLSKYVRPRVFNRPELVLIELVPEK
jgi:predicted MPP superfamily phosphohydrolase